MFVGWSVMKSHEDVEFEGSESYHIRCEYNPKTGVIKIPVIEGPGINPFYVIIRHVSPLLGHPKTENCCKG